MSGLTLRRWFHNFGDKSQSVLSMSTMIFFPFSIRIFPYSCRITHFRSLNGSLFPQFFEKAGHVLTEGLHGLDAFGVILHIPGFSADAEVPVTGSGDDHLAVEEE